MARIGGEATEEEDRTDEAGGGRDFRQELANFSAQILDRPLRPYQLDAAAAIARSVVLGQGLTFTVMMARQMGKNELSAHLEIWLLREMARKGGSIVKAAPAFRPQTINSLRRLEHLLRRPVFKGRWKREFGHIITFEAAQIAFYSAQPGANVVGATASLLLEIDEAQDVDKEKYDRDFRPMCAATNATTVLYGTAWTDDTLLERERLINLTLEAEGGAQRHFEFDWRAGAQANPAYGAFVASEIERLGPEHPLIQTQYLLRSLAGGGGFFTPEQRLLLRGSHPREREPQPPESGVRYVAAVDVAGGAEGAADVALRAVNPRKDSTVVGIARVEPGDDGGLAQTRLVEVYWWTGRPLHEQCDQLIRLLRDVWQCSRVVVDATGLGADLAARLTRALGASVVEPYVINVASKSRLAYQLLAHAGSGRLQMWAETGGVESPEAAEFWREVTQVKPVVRAGGQLGFAVPEHEGHDDFVTMLALLAWAARGVRPAPARAILAPPERRWREGPY